MGIEAPPVVEHEEEIEEDEESSPEESSGSASQGAQAPVPPPPVGGQAGAQWREEMRRSQRIIQSELRDIRADQRRQGEQLGCIAGLLRTLTGRGSSRGRPRPSRSL